MSEDNLPYSRELPDLSGTIPPLTDNDPMPWGKAFHGRKMRDIPIGYWEWFLQREKEVSFISGVNYRLSKAWFQSKIQALCGAPK